jgi:hypothetical protein
VAVVDVDSVAFMDFAGSLEIVTGFVALLALFDLDRAFLVSLDVGWVVSAGHVGLLVGLLSLNLSVPITSRIIAKQAAACLIWWTPESGAASPASVRSNQASRWRLQAA